MTANNHDRKEGRSANSGFAKKRVQWLIEHSTSHQILWYVDSLVLRNPLLQKAAKTFLKIKNITYLPANHNPSKKNELRKTQPIVMVQTGLKNGSHVLTLIHLITTNF